MRKPLSSYPPPTILRVWDESGAKDSQGATPAATRFGLVALREAQAFARTHEIKAERCTGGFTYVPASCGDPAAFVSSFYFRQVVGLVLMRCPSKETVCIDATIQGLMRDGEDHLMVETDATSVDEGPLPLARIRSITVLAGSTPIE
jgi:hypothetical protein